jgi:hypothetical protein
LVKDVAIGGPVKLYDALIAAAANGWLEALEKINKQVAEGDSLSGLEALCTAAERGDAAAIRLLMKLDRIHTGRHALDVAMTRAAVHNQPTAMMALHEFGAVYSPECLRAAMLAGHEDATRLAAANILKKGDEGRRQVVIVCAYLRAHFNVNKVSEKIYQIVDDLCRSSKP